MLHVISARCVARDLHTIAPGSLERTCWNGSRRSKEIVTNLELRLSMRLLLLLLLLLLKMVKICLHYMITNIKRLLSNRLGIKEHHLTTTRNFSYERTGINFDQVKVRYRVSHITFTSHSAE